MSRFKWVYKTVVRAEFFFVFYFYHSYHLDVQDFRSSCNLWLQSLVAIFDCNVGCLKEEASLYQSLIPSMGQSPKASSSLSFCPSTSINNKCLSEDSIATESIDLKSFIRQAPQALETFSEELIQVFLDHLKEPLKRLGRKSDLADLDLDDDVAAAYKKLSARGSF